jgi:hypothetical protein
VGYGGQADTLPGDSILSATVALTAIPPDATTHRKVDHDTTN